MDVKDLPKGSNINVTIRHVSQSGMMRIIDLHYIDDGSLKSVDANISGFPYKFVPNHGGGYKVEGAGMDMAFKIVYDLGQHLHNDGYYFKHSVT